MTTEGRFLAKVDKSGGCWLWTARLSYDGYPMFYLDPDHRTVRAHRVSYEWANGPIPTGLTIDHLCRNRACVNPDHLEAVTIGENVSRGTSLPATARREGVCMRGHPRTPENLYRYRNGATKCRPCTRERERALKASRRTAR